MKIDNWIEEQNKGVGIERYPNCTICILGTYDTFCQSRKKFIYWNFMKNGKTKSHDSWNNLLVFLPKRVFQDSGNSADISFSVAVDIYENIIFPSCPSGKYKSRNYEIGNVW